MRKQGSDYARARQRLAALLAFSCCLHGQTVEPETTADRPGFRNSTRLVGPGVVQVENGLQFSREHVLQFEPELRIGIFPRLELRLKAESAVLRSPEKTGSVGASGLQVGVKFPVFNRPKGPNPARTARIRSKT